MSAAETLGVKWGRVRFMSQDEIFWFPTFFQDKNFLKMIILRCPVLYFNQLPPMMDPSLGDTASMGNTQKRKPWSLGSKNDRWDDWMGFHQGIFVQVKHLIPILTGYISPYINVEWMLSYSKVINHISFTFRLSLKKKWKNVHISKPGLRYFCYYCAGRAGCSPPDIEEGWL